MSELNGEDQRKLQALLQDHARKLRKIEVNGYKRMAFSLVFSILFGVLLFSIPYPYSWLLSSAVLTFVLYSLWTLRPGRCTVCARVTGLSVPRKPPFVPHAWWDLRPYPRKDYIHVCPEHFFKFLNARVRRNNGTA